MAIVLPLSVSVETHAAAGREVVVEMPSCPDCASSMGGGRATGASSGRPQPASRSSSVGLAAPRVDLCDLSSSPARLLSHGRFET